MLRISCPHCGTRDEDEFQFGGELRPPRPEESVTDAHWAEHLFYRCNAKGPQRERWCHSFGCGQWFTVERDTLTHEISDISAYAGAIAERSQ